ncbi:hypothetical protein Q3G72_019503 [Acer saccharum]|nr:hypothetical protein Q3G72_019503 [Acer saccharum]
MVIVDLLERAEPRGVAVEDLEDGPAANSAVEFALLELLLQAPQQQGSPNMIINVNKSAYYKSHVGFKEDGINAFVYGVVDDSLSEKKIVLQLTVVALVKLHNLESDDR